MRRMVSNMSHADMRSPVHVEPVKMFMSMSERRCPECGTRMSTNGEGRFRCRCGFEDCQSVRRLKDRGLDYTSRNNIGDSSFGNRPPE